VRRGQEIVGEPNKHVPGIIKEEKSMNTVTATEFKHQFSSVIKQVRQGKQFILQCGRNHENVAVILPFAKCDNIPVRKFGILGNRGPLVIADDFYMSEEEFLLR
jgi:antitoxin (DNA-binding transcriptional repressor) of toxin-antitoxin stability system